VDGVTQAGECSAVAAANGGPFVSGEAPTLATMKPNGTLWVKEIRWTPLTASDTVVADAKAHNSIGDLCAVRGCADPYAAAGASKAPLPTPPTPTVNPMSPNPYVLTPIALPPIRPAGDPAGERCCVLASWCARSSMMCVLASWCARSSMMVMRGSAERTLLFTRARWCASRSIYNL
jgi:hypothetical protein